MYLEQLVTVEEKKEKQEVRKKRMYVADMDFYEELPTGIERQEKSFKPQIAGGKFNIDKKSTQQLQPQPQHQPDSIQLEPPSTEPQPAASQGESKCAAPEKKKEEAKPLKEEEEDGDLDYDLFGFMDLEPEPTKPSTLKVMEEQKAPSIPISTYDNNSQI
eukprot:TRINITY_DN6640_c0_g1_i1.p1 TRINITY_DN6640_c0_g1~~TRINITY_DN6640_c0_g1_i1.p1  ORF type:complete len:160 (+),score=70.50 TRINITY_DN6640_c0_g1_i1:467-946(+)